MQVVRYEDPTAFRKAVEAFLRRDEARHNLMLGLLDTLIDRPEVYREHDLRLVKDGDEVVLAGLRTPPHNQIVSANEVAGAIEALARGLAAEGVALPGVLGGLPEADHFADAWAEATGARPGARMDQAIHVLESVEDVPVPPGSMRATTADDLELLIPWYRAFHEEAELSGRFDEAETRRLLPRKLTGESGGGLRIWEDGEPVSVVGFTAETGGARRVGPVYTPTEHRRKGYATALTAHVSKELLEGGARFCLLYMDLANPTSNAIYRRIGYVPVCESAMIELEGP